MCKYFGVDLAMLEIPLFGGHVSAIVSLENKSTSVRRGHFRNVIPATVNSSQTKNTLLP